MDLYDRMRKEIACKLQEIDVDADAILATMDVVATKYVISKRECGSDNGYETNNLHAILDEYIACCSYEKMSDGTIKNYKLLLSRLFQKLNTNIEEVRTVDLRNFLREYQEERGVSDRTLDKYREYLSAFWKWAINEGYTSQNPTTDLHKIRYEKKQRESLSQTDLEYIRQVCHNDKRGLAIIEFLYSTGCRVSELCNTKKSDIDWDKKTVHLFGKNKKNRLSFLNAKAEVYLNDYLDSRTDDSEFLFVTKRGAHKMTPSAVQKFLRDTSAEIANSVHRPITPHVLRHTTATTALRSGMPIEDIRALLGHENIETTLVYAQTCVDIVQANHKRCVV